MAWLSWNLLSRNGECAESVEGSSGLGCEVDREVRVELESAAEERDRLRRLTASGGDHPGVKAHQRVLGAEVKGLLAGLGRAVEVAAAVESPGEDVPGHDARTYRNLRPGLRDRARQVFGTAVVGGEESQLEIGVDAVRGVQLLDGGDERVLRVGLVLVPGGTQHVTVPDDEIREGDGPYRPGVERGGGIDVTARGRHPGLPGESRGIARNRRQRRGIVMPGAVDIAAVEVKVTELNVDPGDIFGVAGAGGHRLLHRGHRAVPVAQQFPDI